MQRQKHIRIVLLLLLCTVICCTLCSCSKSYAGVYKGRHSVFSLTLSLKSNGSYVFKQYESLTGGITEQGKYEVKGNTIYYYDSRGKTLKYTGTINGNTVTLGSLKMSK